MYCKSFLLALFILTTLGGCASVASSSAPYTTVSERTTGPVFLVTDSIPETVPYETIGHVKANARVGYGRVESLYPLIAEEARKVGANAIINVRGGRTVAAFSWAAPFVGGTAIKIDDPTILLQYGAKQY